MPGYGNSLDNFAGDVREAAGAAVERRHGERGVRLAALERAAAVGTQRERRARERRDGDAADRAVERPVEAADAVAHDRTVLRIGDDGPGLHEVTFLLLAVEVPADGAEGVIFDSQVHGHASLWRKGWSGEAAGHVAKARVEYGRPCFARLVEHHLQAFVAALRLVVDGHRVEDVHRSSRDRRRRTVGLVRPRDERHHLRLEDERIGKIDLRELHAGSVLARHVLRYLREGKPVRAEDGTRTQPPALRETFGEIPFESSCREHDHGGKYGQFYFHGGKSIPQIARMKRLRSAAPAARCAQRSILP